MRRVDRQMSRAFGLTVVDQCAFATLCLTRPDGTPYGVAINPVRVGDAIYFHSAKEGEKVELLAQAGEICLVCVGRVEVTEPDGSHIGYESAVVFGPVAEVTDEGEKEEAMVALSLRYTPEKGERREYIRKNFPALRVYRIQIATITAKRKKFDPQGRPVRGDGA